MSEAQFYRSMLDNFYEGVYFVDAERKITFWNKGAERITGFSANEVLGSYCYDNILNHVDEKGTPLCIMGCPLHQSLADGNFREMGIYLHHKEGHRVKIFARTSPIEEEGVIIGAVEVFVDDSERAAIAASLEELKQLALFDQLTELPNRRYAYSYLESSFREYGTLGIPFGIAYLDIDHFKHINDRHGHETGDRVLQMVGKTCLSALRKRDLVARWGGEEFLAVFPGIDADNLSRVVEKLRMLVENSRLRQETTEIGVTISAGATLVAPGDDPEAIICRADELLYQSKQSGRNRVSLG